MEILDCIHADHDALRERMIDLETSWATFDERRSDFQVVTSLAESVLKSEDGVLLAWATPRNSLRRFALGAASKLELIEHLLRSIRLTTNEEAWTANVALYCDLVRDYLNAVEKSLLPSVHDELVDAGAIEMGQRYLSYRKHSQSREALNCGCLALRLTTSRYERSTNRPAKKPGGKMNLISIATKSKPGRIVSGLSAAVVTAALASACTPGSKNETNAGASEVATTAAAQSNASQVAEITFEKGSSILSQDARQALIKVVNQARSTGLKIDDVRVAAWADREYPTNAQEKLTKNERELANKRALAVRDFLKSSLSVSDVNTYNMAQQPGAFAKAFDTSDAKVKQAFESAGMPNTGSGTTLTAKASRAIVMVITE